MPREYRHIKEYEKEIIEMFKQGMTRREIAEKLGFTYEQIKGFKHRYNVKQRQIEAGTALKRKGRPTKSENGVPPSIQKLDKIAQLKYEIACKDRKIKSLEAESTPDDNSRTQIITKARIRRYGLFFMASVHFSG